jgi:hypothetical protein
LTANDDQDIRDAALAVGSARYVLKAHARGDLCFAIDVCLADRMRQHH